MSRTYDENMPIAELMGKINRGEIKKVKSVRRYYDQDMPIAELMRKINSGEIKKIEPRKPVRPRRKLRIVDDDDVKRYRFQDDVWKTILEYLLSPASKAMVKLRTASALWLKVVVLKCGFKVVPAKWTKAKNIECIISHVRKPEHHHNWVEFNREFSLVLCDKIVAEDFSVKITQREVDSLLYSRERHYEYLYDLKEYYKDYLPTTLTGRARERALEDRARELADRERREIEYYRGL